MNNSAFLKKWRASEKELIVELLEIKKRRDK